MGRTMKLLSVFAILAAGVAGVALFAMPSAAVAPASSDAVPSPAVAAAPATPAEIQLAQAEATQPPSTLPGGASSLQETYDDWQVSCVQQAAGKRCAMSQQQMDQKSRQRVLAMELSVAGDKVEGVLVLPFGLALEKGAALQVDDGETGAAIPFRTCLPAGCIVPVSFDAAVLDALRKGTAVKVKVTADGGAETAFSISLKGFTGALDRTAALAAG